MKQLAILIILAVGTIFLASNNDYVEIPSSSIRMRVIAASDEEKDQKNKLEIKSLVEQMLYNLIDREDDISAIEKRIEENKDDIDAAIEDVIQKENMGVSFKSSFGENYFPQKEFRGLVYKAGNYKSFVVEFGEAKGENWWCVLYPPLCLIDEEMEDYEYHSLIKDVLAKYN